MAATSRLFDDLEKRVSDLAAKFADDQLRQERDNPFAFQPDLDRLAAFRLLAHAEIEDYLERKARVGIGDLETALKSQAALSAENLARFLTVSTMVQRVLPYDCFFDVAAFKKHYLAVLEDAREYIDKNNGIKSESFIKLAILSGKPVSEIDLALASSLSTFGRSRGDVAHKSVARTTTLLAPSAEVGAVASLILSLRYFYYGSPTDVDSVGSASA